GGQGRRRGGREDEAGGVGADRVDEVGVGGDVAAHHTERLAEGALDDVDLIGRAVALGDTAAAQAVEADGVDFVEVGDGAVLLGQRRGGRDVGDVAVHG